MPSFNSASRAKRTTTSQASEGDAGRGALKRTLSPGSAAPFGGSTIQASISSRRAPRSTALSGGNSTLRAAIRGLTLEHQNRQAGLDVVLADHALKFQPPDIHGQPHDRR